MPVHLHAPLGQGTCRRHEIGPAPGAEARVRQPESRHLPRHGDRERAAQVAVILDCRPAEHVRARFAREWVVRRVQSARRHHPEGDRPRAIPASGADEHVAPAAEPAHPGLDCGQREARGDGGVDRVAAPGQHSRADLGRGLVLGGDHAALARHRGLADDPSFRPLPHRCHVPLPKRPGPCAAPAIRSASRRSSPARRRP